MRYGGSIGFVTTLVLNRQPQSNGNNESGSMCGQSKVNDIDSIKLKEVVIISFGGCIRNN
jgi:hypothetical protein